LANLQISRYKLLKLGHWAIAVPEGWLGGAPCHGYEYTINKKLFTVSGGHHSWYILYCKTRRTGSTV